MWFYFLGRMGFYHLCYYLCYFVSVEMETKTCDIVMCVYVLLSEIGLFIFLFRFIATPTRCSCSCIQFSRCEIYSKCQFSMLVCPYADLSSISDLYIKLITCISSLRRAWHSAAADNTLWRSQYSLMFGDYDNKTTDLNQKLYQTKEVVLHSPVKGDDSITNIDWREIFKRKFIGMFLSGMILIYE